VDPLLRAALAEHDPVQGGGAGDGGDPVRRRVVGELERAHDLVQAMSQISRMKGPERERVRVLDATRSVALLLDRKVGPGGGIVLDVPPHLHVIAHRARFHALLGCLLSGGGMRAGDPAVHVLARRCEGPDGCGDACEGLRLEVRMPRLVPLEPADRPVSLRQWVARGLAEELGGALEVIDEERRTLFRFHLPSGERTASPTSGRAHEGPTRVLIADDEEIIRNLLQEVCERAGVEVRLVTSGLGALEVLRQERFDYVILDLIMPGPMDGFETLRWIEKVAPDVKVIISSGRNPDRKMEDCIARAFAFVPKPFKVSDIVELIRPGHGREARAPAPALESGAPF
jgi:CheY-like chemotaxis protein